MITKKHSLPVVAISGIKNSGKTTLIQKVVSHLKQEGYRIGVIKHDGHSFEADHKGTDSYKHKEAGAECVMVYSEDKLMFIKEHKKAPSLDELLAYYTDMDLVIVEGMKKSDLPKIEIIRGCNGAERVCNPDTVIATVTDIPDFQSDKSVIGLNDVSKVVQCIKQSILGEKDI